MKKIGMFVVGLALAMQAFACSGSQQDVAEDDAEEALGATYRIYETDNGKTIAVEEGKTVRVYLASSPSTGFDWTISSVDRSIGWPTATFMPASNRTRFEWATASAIGSLVGLHSVTFSYMKAGSTKVLKTFSVTLDIKAKARHIPVCTNAGTRSESWAWADGSGTIGYANCANAKAVCRAGSNGSGYYSSTDSTLIVQYACA